MKSRREQRLGSEIRKVVYEIITAKLMLTDGVMFTITDVDVSPDIKHAKVYISIYTNDAEKKAKVFERIVKSASEIRKELSQMMRTRTVPLLHFYEDGSSSYGEKIDRIISTFTYGDNDETK